LKPLITLRRDSKPDSTRRQFISAAASFAGCLAGCRELAAAQAAIRVGITPETRPSWNGPDNFFRAIVEASQVGFRWVETFWPYVHRWEKNPGELSDILAALHLELETVSNFQAFDLAGSTPEARAQLSQIVMNTNFHDPAQRKQAIEDHMRLVRFMKYFECDHFKINPGPMPPGGHTSATYREIGITLTELGKMTRDMGMKLGVHPHVMSSLDSRKDIDAVMERTDPQFVFLVHDTHQITMEGIDPVEFTKAYGKRTIEYHLGLPGDPV
jgi:sugar phosphate isomerase/epimerase